MFWVGGDVCGGYGDGGGGGDGALWRGDDHVEEGRVVVGDAVSCGVLDGE